MWFTESKIKGRHESQQLTPQTSSSGEQAHTNIQTNEYIKPATLKINRHEQQLKTPLVEDKNEYN